uniref:magnesium transporter CorA family protein n=1 Tax=Paraconexibacter sp. TaxID=2949640 RepID=UPI003566EC97
MARTRLYRNGALVLEDFPPREIAEHLVDADAFVWLDYCRPSEDDLATIEEELSLHKLALESALGEHERPKLDRYDTHLYLSAYAVALDAETGTLAISEVGAFVTRNALVTVRKDEGYALDGVLRRWDESAELAVHGVAFLLWGLLDDIVDRHFDAVHELDSEIEGLEDLLFDDRPHDTEVQRRSFELRKSLVRLRRVVLPMREVVNALMRRDLHVLDPGMAIYYQDVYDHVLRA